MILTRVIQIDAHGNENGARMGQAIIFQFDFHHFSNQTHNVIQLKQVENYLNIKLIMKYLKYRDFADEMDSIENLFTTRFGTHQHLDGVVGS